MGISGFIRYRQFTLEEVLPHIGKEKHPFQGTDHQHFIRLGSQRMLLMARQQDCQCCGIKGTFFALEFGGCWSPHLNLYGFNSSGHEVLLTADHIIPRAKGGISEPDNLQLLCTHCNSAKEDKIMTMEQLREKIKNPQISGWQRKPSFVEYRDKLICPLMSPVAVPMMALNINYANFHLYHYHGVSAFITQNKEKAEDPYEMAVVSGVMKDLHEFLYLVLASEGIDRHIFGDFVSLSHCLNYLKWLKKKMIV